MKERPIPLSDHEVRAVLEGRQTQARVLVKPQPVLTTARGTQIIGDEFHEWPAGIIRRKSVLIRAMIPKCPYGIVGSRLWVQEAFALYDASTRQWDRDAVWFRADLTGRHFNTAHKLLKTTPRMAKGEEPRKHLHWRRSNQMPRWASRLLLEIVEIRVERVQEITEEDAKAAGVEPARAGVGENGEPIKTYRTGFVRVWNSFNEKRGFGWLANPFVWVITFRKVGE